MLADPLSKDLKWTKNDKNLQTKYLIESILIWGGEGKGNVRLFEDS